MNNYYNNYLTSSECYKNINQAISNTELQIKNIQLLSNAFNNASGNNIDLIKIDLLKLKTDLENYENRLKNIINQLTSNANRFDGVLANWISKIGTDWKTVEKNKVDLGDLIITKYKREVIDNVGISENGYIDVEVESFSYEEDYNPETKKTKRIERSGRTWNHYEKKFDS